METTRFAPSPNGPLHLGHAYSAVVARGLAGGEGRFMLRIEDIDGPRSRPEHAEAFRADLAWLGIAYEEVAPQSARTASYAAAAEALRARGLLYPCRCTRAEIAAAGGAASRYPGTCRERAPDPAGPIAWRLDARAAAAAAGPLDWEDALAGRQRVDPAALDDVVLVRKGLPASYHLAATLDDAADGVTLVTRGMDLVEATPIHRLLQALLGLPVPRWHHHPLLLDESGRKLSKSRGSAALSARRVAGEDGLLLAAQLAAHRFPAGITLGAP